ncbi:arginyltransferase, partial [Spirochaetota bacterium]
TDIEDFMANFYSESCPSVQSEYYLKDQLIAVGFLDMSSKSLSSIYFIFKTAYEKYSLGTFGALKEIEYTSSLGLKYYYLGYYIENNQSMSYKNRFQPNEKYNWQNEKWY